MGGKGSKRVSLSEFDPLAKRPKPRAAAGAGLYVPLHSVQSIVVG
jgi:hypothetical protein